MENKIMTTISAKAKTSEFHDIIWDKEMTLRSKALLLCLLSYPEGERIKQNYLVQELSEGKCAIRKAMEELISLGYVVREKLKNDAGQFSGCEVKAFKEKKSVL